MKKALAIIGMTVLGVVVLASCKKDYTCTCGTAESDYTGLTKSQADAQKANCEFLGCTWAEK